MERGGEEGFLWDLGLRDETVEVGDMNYTDFIVFGCEWNGHVKE